MEFKVGDKIRITGGISCGEVGTICEIDRPYGPTRLWCDDWSGGPGRKQYIESSKAELLETKNIIMNIKEKFLLAITSEPEKSFRKAGATNGDNLLTEDGQKIFLSWLLKKNADAFKVEVVDVLLAEDKE